MRRPHAYTSGLLAALVLLAAPACWAVTLTRGPYLTLQTRNSITVVWNTDIAANCGLSIGPTGGGTTVLAGPALTTVCAVTAGGLTPGASYSYVPQANGLALRSTSTFRADHPTAPFRFGVVGDTGTGSSGQAAVRDRMLAGGLDLLVHTGDMVYEHGELADQDPMFFTPYKDLIRQLVFWPVMGNHDYEDADTWSQVHFTPANNAAHNDTYYSFDRGNAHFVVIDSDQSTSRGSPQYVFLDQDLAASTARWKFVFFHHAFYVSSGSSSNLRSNLAPLFDAYRVDIAFMGHVHVYERSMPLRGGSVVAPGAGTVYVTTGGGGAPLTSASSSSTTAYSESANHYTRVSIDGGTLALEMIRRDGAVRDTMTLVKGAAGSTTTTTTIVTTTTSTTTSTTLPPGTSGVDVRVSAGSDDAEEDAAGAVSLTSGDLELTRDSTDQTVGIRFRSVAIPPGATIQRAWVQLTVDEASSDATALTLAGEDVDNSVTFTTGTRNVSSRSRTPETVAWSPSSWQAVGQAGTAQRTPDVTAIVRRIVSRSGWRSGNALSVIITGTGRRVAVAFEGSSTGAALLHVEYGAAAATTSTTSTTTTTLLPTTTVPPPTTSTTTTTTPAPSTTTTITTPPVGTGTVEARVAAGSDDAEEDTQGGVSLTSSDLELTVDSSAQTVGIRFAGVAIPPGATVQRAWVQLTVDEASSEATALTIAGENVDTSATFTTATRNVSNRSRTPETVAWSPSAWSTIGQAGAAQRTPDLTAIVQRIVSRSNWRSGNALSLIITGTGRRVAVAFEAASAAAALLHVEYGTAATTSTTSTSTTTLVPTTIVTTSTTTTSLAPTTTTTLPITAGTVEARVAASSDDAEEDTAGKVSLTSSDLELTVDSTAQTIGMRFRGLTIPRGAQILSAWVQFKADKATSDATSLTIAGEAADNAVTFTTATRNVSGRARTTASVAWTPAVWPTAQAAGAAQRTPDLAAVVQQIVARPGWASGNALVLLVTGTGKRVAVSFDAEAAGAPLLHVEYGPPPTTTTTSTSTTTTSSTTSTTEPPTTTTTTEPSTTSTTEPSTTTTTTEPTTSTTEPSTTTTTTEPSTSTTEPPTTTTTTEPSTSTTEPSTTTTTTEPPGDLETTTTTEVVSTTTTTEPAP